MLSKLNVLIQISLRNLFVSKINLIIGGIIALGTVLVVVGSSLLDSVERSMAQSIRGSVAGDIQVYSAKSKDEIALFGSMSGESDLAPVTDFDQIESVLKKVPGVKRVVPMGISAAMVSGGNTIDLTLADLREAVKSKDSERRESLKGHVRQIVRVLQQDQKRLEDIRKKTADDAENEAIIAKASSDEFWNGFDKDPDSALEYLENRVAPQISDADLLYLRYMGTDLDQFSDAFDRLEIVDGTRVPKGQRGFLFNKRAYEEQVKLKAAYKLDRIKEARDVGTLIKDDATLLRYVKENKSQLRDIILQLDPQRTEKAVSALQKGLGAEAPKTSELRDLLVVLFDTNDDNFEARYQLFYKELAPLLQLYTVRVGDTLTIKAFTRSGYIQSTNVKIYGTFQFKGLEKASLSGAVNLMDMMSFRDLYGYLTADKLGEIADIKKAAGAKEVTREDAESALFGDGAEAETKAVGRTVEASATPGVTDPALAGTGAAQELRRQDLVKRVYSREEMRKGLVLNAALLLDDPSKVDETIAAVQKAADDAKLDLKVVSWQTAAGLIGQFVLVSKLGLFFAVFIIFIVVLVIINNAVMMATMQRVRELGTMRAIGSQKSFVLAMILFETVVLGAVFGGVGLALGSSIIGILHSVGIPAGNEELYFFFSGPRLFPTVGVTNVLIAFVIVMIVSAISTLYPAYLAAKISPLAAMQTDE
jgi:ABC-type lipoprotein release transport system permease subunit